VRIEDFDYELPAERIAQEPVVPRDAARLMVVDRGSDTVGHCRFADLPDLLVSGDLLVLNDTRVIPARLRGRKPTGGRVEVLLVERAGGPDERPLWRCLLDAARPPAPGSRILFAEPLEAEVVTRSTEGWTLRFGDGGPQPQRTIERIGRVPLPPYIRRSDDDARHASDRVSYQTVYARVPGAVAAPTAGLHFTPAMLDRLAARGVGLAGVTLHVGPGTFLPVRAARVEEHRMHEERFVLPTATAEAVAAARGAGRRVIAVGTTVVRTLEHRARGDGTVEPGEGSCGLFILPGHHFRVVDAMLTNFHLPRSTLLMLISAFAGRERILRCYAEAVRRGYRFYSYGDAMMIT